MSIHPSAVISPDAKIGDDVEIGPFCVIEANVTLGKGCRLHSHVVIHGHTTIGDDNEFFPFAAIGIKSQDLKYAGEPTALIVGHRNVFRENATIHRGTLEELPTRIGNDNLFLSYSHVAHDCQVGNHVILSNNGTLGGHVIVEDHVIVSGLAGVHQFCRLGQHSLIGGITKIVQDVPPFTIVDGNPAAVRMINKVGLERRGFTPEDLTALKRTYKKLFLRKDGNLSDAIAALPEETASQPTVKKLLDFIAASERGIIR
ncbi:MAG: acyl-ACP--UDP-N-acetylglucosamine O-acyltransferase [Verrucomicrobiaceae bacterium]